MVVVWYVVTVDEPGAWFWVEAHSSLWTICAREQSFVSRMYEVSGSL